MTVIRITAEILKRFILCEDRKRKYPVIKKTGFKFYFYFSVPVKRVRYCRVFFMNYQFFYLFVTIVPICIHKLKIVEFN